MVCGSRTRGDIFGRMPVSVEMEHAGDPNMQAEVRVVIEHVLADRPGDWRVSIVGSEANDLAFFDFFPSDLCVWHGCSFCNGCSLQSLHRGSQPAHCAQTEARRALAVRVFDSRVLQPSPRALLVCGHCSGSEADEQVPTLTYANAATSELLTCRHSRISWIGEVTIGVRYFGTLNGANSRRDCPSRRAGQGCQCP